MNEYPILIEAYYDKKYLDEERKKRRKRMRKREPTKSKASAYVNRNMCILTIFLTSISNEKNSLK